jgi:A/G-specific adenine glycosylase
MTRKSSVPGPKGARRTAFQAALLAWYRAHRRRLPWRESPSPYATVVSEFMLQQTQVATVLPYFARWMAAFPDFASLAAASESAILRVWEGLGYYSRARNLHSLGKAVTRSAGLPASALGWEELPGVGPYTAAAIASIAFGEACACVDGNVVRVLARLTRDATPYRDSASASKAFGPLAQELLNPLAPGDHNQAMMELGATLCTKRNPSCLVCPVRTFCAAGTAGDPEAYPSLAPKRFEQRSVVRVWCERAGAILLHCNASGSRRLAGLHELPTAEQAGLDPADAALGPLVLKRTRGITRFRIIESIHSAKAPKRRGGPGLAWIRIGDLESIALSGPHRRWMTQVLSSRQRPKAAHAGRQAPASRDAD